MSSEAATNQLNAGHELRAGGQLVLGPTSARMQSDGNFVLYKNSTACWSTHTSGQGGFKLQMQTDGNLVLRKSNGTALWSSGKGDAGDPLLLVDGVRGRQLQIGSNQPSGLSAAICYY